MRLTLVLALAFLCALAPIAVSASSWVYYDIREPKNQFVLEDSPASSAWMDAAGSAEFCARTEPYQCFKAGNFEFAVPRGFHGKEKEWMYGGVLYKVSGTSRRFILGRRYFTYFIERDFGSHRLRFLFTREAGLIAITTIGQAQSMVLILSGKCGYGASPLCHRSN